VIVDASAILAILLSEPEGPQFERKLASAIGRPLMSPFNYLEAAIRVERLEKPHIVVAFDKLIAAFDIEITQVGAEQTRLAREAYQRFGKGRHPARLNIGDCFAYALSKARDEPLLYKGGDFSQTDVEAAL